jgi:hypothetical protein
MCAFKFSEKWLCSKLVKKHVVYDMWNLWLTSMRWVPYTTLCDGCHIPHNPMDAIYRGINVIHYHVTRMWSSYNLFLFCRRFVVDMDIKNRQSRDTGNIRYTRHRTKEKNHQHPEEQHELHLKSGMNPCGRDG